MATLDKGISVIHLFVILEHLTEKVCHTCLYMYDIVSNRWINNMPKNTCQHANQAVVWSAFVCLEDILHMVPTEFTDKKLPTSKNQSLLSAYIFCKQIKIY